MIAVAVLAAGILAVAVAVAVVLADVRDRRPIPPVPRRVLDHYDADGHPIDDRPTS